LRANWRDDLDTHLVSSSVAGTNLSVYLSSAMYKGNALMKHKHLNEFGLSMALATREMNIKKSIDISHFSRNDLTKNEN
jgi:hypothetical protein